MTGECVVKPTPLNPEEIKEEENYSVFEDWHDVLENCHNDLYQTLDESHAWDCFDVEAFYRGESYTQLKDGRVVFTY